MDVTLVKYIHLCSTGKQPLRQTVKMETSAEVTGPLISCLKTFIGETLPSAGQTLLLTCLSGGFTGEELSIFYCANSATPGQIAEL